MQLASTGLVVQSFRYGPRHFARSGDAAGTRSTHGYTTVYGVPILSFVRGGLIHFRAAAGSVTVTLCNAFDDWHHRGLAQQFLPGTLGAFVSRFVPRRSFRAGDDVLPRSGDVLHVTKAA